MDKSSDDDDYAQPPASERVCRTSGTVRGEERLARRRELQSCRRGRGRARQRRPAGKTNRVATSSSRSSTGIGRSQEAFPAM